MTAFILPDDGSDRVIVFDAILDELHETVSEITEHPVETGVDTTDHVRPLPDRINLVGFISNQPIIINPFTERGEIRSFKMDVPKYEPPLEPTPGSIFRNTIAAVDGLLFGESERTAQVLAFPDYFDARREMHEVLIELQKNAVLLEIFTSLRWYEDMLLERVSAPRTAGDSGIAFALDVRQVRVVESGQVAAAPVPAEPRGQNAQAKGSQGTKSENTADDLQSASIAHQLIFGDTSGWGI